MRINKYLASTGLSSRRKIDQMIIDGQVMVNGKIAKLGMQVDPKKDEISIGKNFDKLDKVQKNEYWKIYKPVGMVSTTDDPEGRPTVLSLMEGTSSKTRLYPVGRLDIESEGLMILTNDGDLTQKLTHPKHHTSKEYLVWANGSLSDRDLMKLQRGVKLSDGMTASAKVEIIFREPNRVKLSIVIHEGRHRQIRRMAAKVGLMVTRLKRVKIGSIEIEDMYEGEVRRLTPAELEQLQNTF